MSKRAILFIAWGDRYLEEVQRCIAESRLPDYPILLITDEETDTSAVTAPVTVIRRQFTYGGKERKAEALAALPEDLGTIVFLDVDTRVIGDISLGFDKAERYGIAMAPAPHYSLADFRSFGAVMEAEDLHPRGEMIYNSGVIFFAAECAAVRSVFTLALALLLKHTAEVGDQPYISLAMELQEFNPYTLSPSFNHRAFGELISGAVRIWHSYQPLPADAGDVDAGYLRRYENGALVRALRVPL
jgi:hypothetical protein